MFGWFYEFLYMISKTLFRLIDGLILCANKLCGIETINFDGEETDFLSYLLRSDTVGFAFRVSAILATVLLVAFTIYMIIRSILKDKAEGTPIQIAVKSFKTLLMFFFVPVVILAFMTVGNKFMNALYSATIHGASTPGAFLFSAFAVDGGMNSEIADQFSKGILDYNDTDLVSRYMDLSNFPFLFSWLTGGVVLFGIGSAMLVFVDRVLSLVILYIAAPISISTSVMDDGARFKLWRDQFMSKFIMGYGMILAINVYAMVCGLVMNPQLVFFADNSFLNLIMKLLILAGGALTMQKSMALIGNLVSQGGGSNELRDTMSAGALANVAKGLAGKALYIPSLPLRAGKSIVGDAISQQSRHLGSKLLRGLGLEGGYGKRTDKDGVEDPGGDSGSQNSEKANYGTDNNKAKDAIGGGGFNLSWDNNGDKKNDNANNDQPDQKKNDLVGNIINNNDNKQNNQNNDNNNNGNEQNNNGGGGDQ